MQHFMRSLCFLREGTVQKVRNERRGLNFNPPPARAVFEICFDLHFIDTDLYMLSYLPLLTLWPLCTVTQGSDWFTARVFKSKNKITSFRARGRPSGKTARQIFSEKLYSPASFIRSCTLCRRKIHRPECANMGKVKRLELWWQLYRTSLPVRDFRKFQSDGYLFDRVYLKWKIYSVLEKQCFNFCL